MRLVAILALIVAVMGSVAGVREQEATPRRCLLFPGSK